MAFEVASPVVAPRVLAIGASPRKGGNSDIFQNRFLSGAEEAGAVVEGVHLRDLDMTSCVGCEGCRESGECTRFNDGMTPLYGKIIEARGLLLLSPVHNYNITAWMKSFIDRLYCFYRFQDPRPGPWSSRLAGQGRKAMVVAVAEQRTREDIGFALEGMRKPLEALGYEVVDELPVLGVFGRGAIGGRPEVLSIAREFGVQLTRSIQV